MKGLISKLILPLFIFSSLNAQDVSLFQQFNGRYDYTAIGNTLNLVENGPSNICDIQTASSAELVLQQNQIIQAAYLYWAGSGNGDVEVALNGVPVVAERTFEDSLDLNRVFFAAFADVTSIIENTGSGTYTFSEFDITSVIAPYCPSGTNFAGWAVAIIYEDNSLPLNQLNVYDGLQSVPSSLTIILNNLNVLDNEDAKIGFIAWEGDSALAVNEQLSINGNIIGNPPLNPINNAFNGTNSFTGATNLYNMDIDVYNIQNNIAIGDTSATISLTSGQDFVMINNVITVLNSQLPDATIAIDEYTLNCGSRDVEVVYTVSNTNSTDDLPQDTPIAFYAEDTLIGQSQTNSIIPISGSESGTVILSIPESLGDVVVNITVVVDDNGTGLGTVTEINEINNSDTAFIELLIIPDLVRLTTLIECNEGFETASFDLVDHFESTSDISGSFSFFESLEDLSDNTNAIAVPELYTNIQNPEVIYVRVERPPCYEVYSFLITTENCPPTIPEGFSPNNDTKNDWFNIQGLYDIFVSHELQIYNRYGALIFIGNNSKPWLGNTNKGLNNVGERVPVGTYYYVLNLNDPNYKPIVGWVYVNY